MDHTQVSSSEGSSSTTVQVETDPPNETLSAQKAEGRKIRSRKDRPCDHCRRLKHTCRITIRGQPCSNCQKTDRQCTFNAPPVKRHATLEPIAPSSPDLGVLQPFPDITFPTSNTLPNVAFPSSTNCLSSLLQSLKTTIHDAAQTGIEDAFYPSLDLDNNDHEESHYLDASALAIITNHNQSLPAGIYSSPKDTNDHSTPSIVYRQVARQGAPAYFIRNPSTVYVSPDQLEQAQAAYGKACKLLCEEDTTYPNRLLQIFLEKTLPAVPLFDRDHLQPFGPGDLRTGGFPPTIIVGILAHAAVHIPQLRHRCKELWSLVLQLLNTEYRRARLQVLQLAILDIYGRPVYGSGGNHVAISRAVGIAQLLGLHRDCTTWQLPRWERAVRKRVWWSLGIADKWNALAYGRPSNMKIHSVTLPTLKDSDVSANNASLASFVAMSRLTCILDELLPLLALDTLTNEGNIAETLEILAWKMENNFVDLQMYFVSSGYGDSTILAGTQSYRLCRIGLSLVISRLTLDYHISQGALAQSVLLISQHIVTESESLLSFINNLHPSDFAAFWAPWSSYQITQSISLLVRLAAMHQRDAPLLAHVCVDLFDRLVRSIERTVEGSWQVGEDALNRIKLLLPSVRHVPGIEAIKDRLLPAPQLLAVSNNQTELQGEEFLAWVLGGSDNDRMLEDMNRWMIDWNGQAGQTDLDAPVDPFQPLDTTLL